MYIAIIILIALIAFNAFFAMAEIALVSVNKIRIKLLAEQGDKKAAILFDLLERPNRFLSVIQVYITFAGYLQSAIAATVIAREIADRLEATGLFFPFQIWIVVITVILAFINLVFGELVPKRLAMQHSERSALFAARGLQVASVVSFPFVWLLSKTVGLVLLMFKIKDDKIEETYSEEEILSLLEVGHEAGHIDEAGKEMIDKIFRFDDKLAYEIMTPRTDVFMLDINDPLAEYVDNMIESGFARIPFYNNDNDDIIGVLSMKDFLIQARKVGFTRVNVRKLLKKPFFVPDSKNIALLFKEMKNTKTHMAFLVDEYGGLSGIVTIEDLIEEVVGDISDEYDENEPKLEKIDEKTWLIGGGFYLDDLNEKLDLKLESDDYETVGGLIIEHLGEIMDDDEVEKQVIYIEKRILIKSRIPNRYITGYSCWNYYSHTL